MFIDNQRVYMQSGRGCDASNVHDEEVLNPNEMYYSDDEQERHRGERDFKQTGGDAVQDLAAFRRRRRRFW